METILCPTDFSASSENAIRYANELAQLMHARLVLFHTIYEPVGSEINSYGMPVDDTYWDSGYRNIMQDKLTRLRKAVENEAQEGSVTYETKIKYGLTKDTIPQMAQEVQADIIVIGTEEADGLKDIFLGSVTADVIKRISCPALIIPPKATFKPIRKIVFATDLQGEPFIDVAFVTKLAGLLKAEILFLHILTDESEYTQQLAQAELDLLQKRLSYKKATFHTEVNAHIEEGISQFCRRHKADMLVMGYHPHSFWKHLFSQDYTQEMAYHTYLPLMVIHYRN